MMCFLPSAVLFLPIVLNFAQTPPAQPGAELPSIVQKANQVTGTLAMEAAVANLSAEKDLKGQLAAAVALLKEKKGSFTVNSLWVLGRTAQKAKLYDEATAFTRAYIARAIELKSPAKILLGYSDLLDFLYRGQKFAECEKACREFLEFQFEGEDDEIATLNRAKSTVLRQMIQCQARQGDGSKALATLDRLLQQDPSDLLNLQLKARVLHQLGKDEEAIEIYEELIPKVSGLERLRKEVRESFVADLRYALSGVYIDTKKIDKAISILKDLAEKYPDNSTYNNDLGYIMADNGKPLDEAEKLVRKAIDLDRAERKKQNLQGSEDRDNPAYLDSLGWVLFKQGKLEEAKKYLLEAVAQEDGQQAEIYDHLAEVQMALKLKSEAVKTWQRALEGEPFTKRDRLKRAEIEKKLKAAAG